MVFSAPRIQKEFLSLENKPMMKVRVLLVEDTPIIQQATQRILAILNCRVEIADNGQSALNQFNRGYDLILLDIGLPDMSGIKVCEEIRRIHPDFKTPIIAYTACGTSVESACRQAGVDDFAVKPLSLEKFKNLLSHWIPGYNQIAINPESDELKVEDKYEYRNIKYNF